MKLILLGNGFDLHHKYKTSFYDFRTHLRNSNKDEDQLLISKIDDLLDVNQLEQKTHLLWNDFESIIGSLMATDKYKKHKVKNIPNLIEEFTLNFYQYLLNISNEKTKNNIKLAKEFEDVSTILTFNYTSFYAAYLKNKEIDVFHIHGILSENDLPIIGYYYPRINKSPGLSDYELRYAGKLIHKSALAYKQNEIDLDTRITQYTTKWKNKITEVVVIGYSFGKSDDHIYKILNDILIKQITDNNIPSSRANNIKLVKFTIYNFNDDESNLLIEKIKTNISRYGKRFSINITGVGFTPKRKDILIFELKDY